MTNAWKGFGVQRRLAILHSDPDMDIYIIENRCRSLIMLLLAFDEDLIEPDLNNAGLFLEIMLWKCFVVIVLRSLTYYVY